MCSTMVRRPAAAQLRGYPTVPESKLYDAMAPGRLSSWEGCAPPWCGGQQQRNSEGTLRCQNPSYMMLWHREGCQVGKDVLHHGAAASAPSPQLKHLHRESHTPQIT